MTMRIRYCDEAGARVPQRWVQGLLDSGELTCEPEVSDRDPGDLPAQPSAFAAVGSVSFFDFEEAEIMCLERGDRGWRFTQALLEGEYYSRFHRTGVIERPWTFLVNTVRADCWARICLDGVTAEEQVEILRAAGWSRVDE
jgi:hypothetical protein